MMEYEEGGLSDQGGTVDPVSGNEVPPGALQEEVRDDIDAKLSEGEFVFPADVVRYIGLEKLMMMRQQAKQGLSMMEKMGQMSNADEAVMEDTAPAAVFDIPDDMDMPAVMVAELEMAEGGDVQGEKRYKSFRELMGTDGDTAEIVTYVNDAGRKIIIMHMNGAPVSQVPEGFYPEGTEPEEEEEAEITPEQPPAAPQAPQVREEESGNEPPVKSGAVITTGGYIDSKAGRVVGGDQWNVSYSLDGGVTLENSEHGKVTLTKEEAAGIGVGMSGLGVGSVLSAFSPEGVAKGRQRQANLSSGEFGNPAAGNEIHKALIEKATLQKMGEQFVKNNSAKVGLGDSIASAFGLGGGKTNEIEGAVANILGKDSRNFTDADYAIIGQALSGTPNQYNLPGATQTDAAKLQEISDAIDEIQSQSGQFADMSLPKPKPKKPSPLSMNVAKIGDDGDDDSSGPPNITSQSDTSGSSNVGLPDVSDDTGPQDPPPSAPTNSSYFGDINTNADAGDDNNDNLGNSYDFSNPSDNQSAYEREAYGGGGGFGGGGRSNPGVGSFSFSGGGSRGYTGGFNKGTLVKKKRKGLASR